MPYLPSLFRLVVGLALSLQLSSCAAPPPAPPRPRLVVFLVVDGLPMRQVTGYRDQLAPDGLARFLDRGTWFANAHYGHAYTVTAPGHASMLTGAYPHRSGIIGNQWRDPVTGEPTYSTGDTSASYIGHPTQPLDGTSPKNLLVETVGDVLRRRSPQSKVIAISGKDRAAIPLAGKTGTAYIYMPGSGAFASSTFYMPRHPAWVERFNADRRADSYFKTDWKPLLADSAYARSVPDEQPGSGLPAGRLPMTMGAADDRPGPAYYAALLRSPFVDEMSLDFARAAIAGEGLGQDDAPDILGVSLSGHDHVNHTWSAESRLSHDHLLQLDRQFQAFFRHLDASVGKDNYLAVLTADHGFMPAPEVSRRRGEEGYPISSSQTLTRINGELEKRYGQPRLALYFSASALVLDRKLIMQQGLDHDAVADAARNALVAQPGLGAAYTSAELRSGSRAGAPFFDAMVKAWHAARSGDIQYVVKPYWYFGSTTTAATHGSPHAYDTHVPILLYGPAWTRAGRIDGRVEVVDIAPTLAGVLGLPAPSASEGRPLPLGAP